LGLVGGAGVAIGRTRPAAVAAIASVVLVVRAGAGSGSGDQGWVGSAGFTSRASLDTQRPQTRQMPVSSTGLGAPSARQLQGQFSASVQ
jgi:hypothetical protein